MSIIIPANSAVAGGYDVENGCRFDRASSDYLQRAFSGSRTGSGTKYTYSTWLKRSQLGTDQTIIYNYVDSSNFAYLYFRGSQKDLRYFDRVSGGDTCVGTSAPFLFDDNTAWYHIVLEVDTTLGTAADRVKMYVNGVFKAFNYDNQPGQNQALSFGNVATRSISSNYNGSNYFDGYQCETIFIDGLALQADSFGKFDADSGIWKPINVSGLTFGSIGFYLEYKNSSALGTDSSGGSNTFTANNIAAIDQSTDTCTNNFCTMNALDNINASTFAEGNLKITTVSGNYSPNTSTFRMSEGKWYWEIKLVAGLSANEVNMVGINKKSVQASTTSPATVGINYRGNGKIWNDGGTAEQSGYATFEAGNILMIAMDLTNATTGKLYFGVNGTYGNSGNPVTGANSYNFVKGTEIWGAMITTYSSGSSATWQANFGGTQSFAISSGNTDDNDRGNFEYDVPAGFLSLCTANISEVLS